MKLKTTNICKILEEKKKETNEGSQGGGGRVWKRMSRPIYTKVFPVFPLGFMTLAHANLIHLLLAYLHFPSQFPLESNFILTGKFSRFEMLLVLCDTHLSFYLFFLLSPLPRHLLGTERGE